MTALLGAPAVWYAAATGYVGDSFHTLAPWPRAGLAVLSVILVAALVMLVAAKSAVLLHAGAAHRWPSPTVLVADLVATVALYVGAAAVAPQIYYTYYRLVIPGLPAQWQVRGWDVVEAVIRQARLLPDASLADQAGGIVFWSLLVMTGWMFVLEKPNCVRAIDARVVGVGAGALCALIYNTALM